MSNRSRWRGILALTALAPLLAGCSIPDLIAHTVKTIEKSQRPAQTTVAPPPTVPAAPPRDNNNARAAEPPLDSPSPVGATGEPIQMEELPPR